MGEGGTGNVTVHRSPYKCAQRFSGHVKPCFPMYSGRCKNDRLPKCDGILGSSDASVPQVFVREQTAGKWRRYCRTVS